MPRFLPSTTLLFAGLSELAIDRDALVRIVLKDLVVEALGILPPGLPGL